MNRFLLFIAITCGLLIGSMYLTKYSEDSTLWYESDPEPFSTPNESNLMESDDYYTEENISDVPNEEGGAHTDVTDDSIMVTERREENTQDVSNEKEEMSQTASYEDEEIEAEEYNEEEIWEGYTEDPFISEDYSFRYANPPSYQSDINTDYALAIFQSDFIESIEQGVFPGLSYTIGMPLYSQLQESGDLSFVMNMDKSQYYMSGISQVGILLDDNEDLTLAGLLLPIQTQLDELVATYGEPQAISDTGPRTYTYFPKEHCRLIFHADPTDDGSLRFLEIY